MAVILKLDTDLLRSTVSVAQQTNEAITEAANLLNQVVIHNDWECVERTQINNNTLANKQTAKDIQDKTSAFYNAISTASSRFDEAEQNTVSRGNSLDEIIGTVVNVVPGISAGSAAGSSINIADFSNLSGSLEE